MVLSNFRKFQFSAPIFGRGATPAPGVWNFENPQKKLTQRVILTTQLLTRNQNFLNISADKFRGLNISAHRWHRWAVGVHDPLKNLAMGPGVLVYCTTAISKTSFTNKSGCEPPPSSPLNIIYFECLSTSTATIFP